VSPSAGEVGSHRGSHLDRKRQPFNAGTLATHHDFPGSPVDIVETQRSYLSAAQSQARQHDQDRVITKANRDSGIATGQQGVDVSGIQCARQTTQAPSRDGRDRCRQRDRYQSADMQEPQQ
jgi:hypothetical protein